MCSVIAKAFNWEKTEKYKMFSYFLKLQKIKTVTYFKYSDNILIIKEIKLTSINKFFTINT